MMLSLLQNIYAKNMHTHGVMCCVAIKCGATTIIHTVHISINILKAPLLCVEEYY